jgi:hypothetical protein
MAKTKESEKGRGRGEEEKGLELEFVRAVFGNRRALFLIHNHVFQIVSRELRDEKEKEEKREKK